MLSRARGLLERRAPSPARAAIALVVLFGLASRRIDAQVVVPKLASYVTDRAGVLSPSQQSTLLELCQALDENDHVKLAILTVPNLQGTTVEDFAQRTFDSSRLGGKGTNRGMLFLLSVGDRKVRLQVGYGLEGEYPDGRVGALLDRAVIPSFKKGDWGGGIIGGVRELLANTETDRPGAPRVPPPVPARVAPRPAAPPKPYSRWDEQPAPPTLWQTVQSEDFKVFVVAFLVFALILSPFIYFFNSLSKGWSSSGSSDWSSSSSSDWSGSSSSSDSSSGPSDGGSSGGGGASRDF